ncbi:MAG: alpha-2-macroglobulin family protein [Verrucomicrobiota bacterium]
MKRTLIALSLAICLPWVSPLMGASRADAWKKVEDAMNQGLPKTAVEQLEPIILGALKEKAYGEAIKAIARRIALEGNVEGNKPEEKITRLEAEIAKAPEEMKPLLTAVLAQWYWHYFEQNRWRFMRRTATAAAPGKDFTTWDLPRLFAEIDKHYTAALVAEKTLKAMPIATFDALLQKGALPDAYRPTVYDFIAHEALKFYTSGEQAAAKAQDAFDLSADSAIFAPAEAFMAWKIETEDTQSPVVKGLKLYQDLMRFHQNDKDPSAFVDLDIARLEYGHNTAFGENKNERFKAALKAVVDRWADHDLSALALYHWAQTVHDENNFVEAHALASRGAKVFPRSAGGKLCQNLIYQIEAKSSQVTVERIWNAPLPKINVSYRNLTEIHFRVVAWDWNTFLDKKHSRPESLNDKERKELLALKPELAWSEKLPATVDYQERVEHLPAPTTLKPGFYFLVSSHRTGFGEKDNLVAYTTFWVSDLSLVVRTHDGEVDGFVLEANSGEPVSGAEVASWYLNNQGDRVENPKTATDEMGFFKLTGKGDRGNLIRVRHNGREVASEQEYNSWKPGRPQPHSQTIFFTDRALYRPGQTIQFKGICLRVDQPKDNYELLPAQKLTVIFADRNGKEIAQLPVQCNDYGSFSGSFTAPRDRLMGQMRIYARNGPNGAAQFSVEEYKRPKFQVSLDVPKTAAKLNDRVSLTGKAESYTGAAVDGAMVKYRIVREVRFPDWWGWCYWWRPVPNTGSQEISHGTLRTKTDGTFTVEFLAKPDLSIAATNEPVFTYTIHADVTDTTGETRSASRGVRVAYTALQAGLSANDWQVEDKPVEVTLRTLTHDGEPQTAEGALKIYALQAPARIIRPELTLQYYWRTQSANDKPAMTFDPNTWPLGAVVLEKGFTTDKAGQTVIQASLKTGVYRVMVETQDRFGKKVTAQLPLRVLKPEANKLAIKIPQLLAAPVWTVEPGQEFMALWGTGYDQGRTFVEIEHRNKVIRRYWTKAENTQEQIRQAVDESMRGGFQMHLTRVRENRAYLESRRVDVPWSNKELQVKWEHFVNKLQPGQKETWTAIVTGPNAQKSVAEMVATLYDESLDAYRAHHWLTRFNIFRSDNSYLSARFENDLQNLNQLLGYWNERSVGVERTYRSFPPDLVQNLYGYQYFGMNAAGGGRMMRARGMVMSDAAMPMAATAAPTPMAKGEDMVVERQMLRKSAADKDVAGDEQDAAKRTTTRRGAQDEGGSATPDLSKVSARKNLNETAFFFPQLVADKDGAVRMEFTMPEALTTWKFMAFAHDQQLRAGFLQDKAITAKDLMIQPNPPRFLREGDVLEFTVKVSNQSPEPQSGKVALSFKDAATDQNVDKLLGNTKTEQAFDIPAKESRSFSWRLKVPDGLGFLTYKAVGATAKLSDGEEGWLPVLSRRILVTESLPLPVRGPATKKFEFTKLLKSGKSDTLQHQSLTVQMVSQPAWYAVMALPYLMEYPYECSEQTFNRLYANALARSIATQDPKIHRIFELWRNTPALDSPLEKNQDLKSVLIEETPWYRQARNESQARRNVGILFEDNRMNQELNRATQKLKEMQLGDGSWPWFPGGQGNDYITLYITTGFGRMRNLGVDVPVDMAIRSLARLDSWMDEHYHHLLKLKNPEDYVPSSTDALYLYGRSFFLKDKPVAKGNQDAVDYFLKQSRKHWLKTASRQTQAHLALALKRWGGDDNLAVAVAIMKSMKERSVTNEEMGRFWRDTELSWWWYHAPIETQALMIEAFVEIMNDAEAVEDCKVWLLKQKQTQDWKTTKATADAVYALLLRGVNMLASDALVEVSLGGQTIKPENVEAGTGFYEKRFSAAEIKPKLGDIKVIKTDAGVSWGSVHWQYLEDMSKVTPYEGTPLKLKKALYIKTNTNKGPVLEPVKAAIQVGDELVVRIELRVDRDMEYVHLKDQRGSGTEPVNVLSRYKYQDGLGYYESTRDTASHFFIDYLPKGVYVFEYSTRVQHRGEYQTGMASIQCMYAPEFNSHSESLKLVVR